MNRKPRADAYPHGVSPDNRLTAGSFEPGQALLGGRFFADELLASLHYPDANDQDAEGPEEQYAVAEEGESVQVYALYVLCNHQRDEAEEAGKGQPQRRDLEDAHVCRPGAPGRTRIWSSRWL